MVYFHGGGWFQSGSYESRGPEFLLDQDIVLVRVNYRLGPLGFLSAEDKILPGNFGLKDQWLALKWVQKNIEHFGGDPNRVTLFGESSGGCSVHLHMFSPRSQGLFQRAISSSGVGVSPVSVMRPGLARKRTGKLATILGCPSNDSREILDCLRAKQPYDIVAAHRKLYVSQILKLIHSSMVFFATLQIFANISLVIRAIVSS
ncbi:hypothetical protein AAG570_003770 [Ranatra chinensis]|uniref:Carboxylic ester hydrolase n=1 Tax=Ranatra chinensis TaxID=642074 RepID=A0ABD0Y4N7_9HEMI